MKETWKAVEGYEGFYEVSNLGRVKSLITNRENQYTSKEYLKKIQINKYGYPVVALYKNGKSKLCTVHRLVAQKFIENTHNYKTVNHKNGIKEDNRSINLEWCSNKMNSQHAYNQLGVRPHNALLTRSIVFEILSLKGVFKYKTISEITNTKYFTVKQILAGNNYKGFVNEYRNMQKQMIESSKLKLK